MIKLRHEVRFNQDISSICSEVVLSVGGGVSELSMVGSDSSGVGIAGGLKSESGSLISYLLLDNSSILLSSSFLFG